MVVLLEAGDPSGDVAAAYLAKELLQDVYATAALAEATGRLERVYAHCRSAAVPELPACPAPCASGSARSWPGTPPGSPTVPPRP